MGDYSFSKLTSSTILPNMTNFTTEMSTNTISKANLQESDLMSSYSNFTATH
jgi:hypothetical protein